MNGPAQSPRGNSTPQDRAAASPADHRGASRHTPPRPTGTRSLRNWRVTTRLHAILLIPVIVGLVMGGFQIDRSVGTWRQAEDAERTARLVQAALTYSQRLVEERDISAAPLLRDPRDGRTDPDVVKARSATDRAAAAFDGAARRMPHTGAIERRLAAFRKAEPGLAKLRARAYTSQLGGVATQEGYVAVQHPLMEFANELGLGTGNITSYGRTVHAISLTKAAVSLQRSIGTQMLVKPGPEPADLSRQRTALSSYAYLEGISIEEYLSGGTPREAAAFARMTDQLKADARQAARDQAAAARAQGHRYVPPPSPQAMVSALAALPGTQPADRRALARKGITADSWWAAHTARFNADRKIEADLAARAVQEAADIADDARRATFVTGGIVLLALLTAFVLAGLMARQISRSMRGLRTAALKIAQQRLPMIVDQLSRTDPGRVDTRVAPLPVTTTDEIGEVARAFDQVHREAVRLAAEQALLRGNVNAIFANLSRRNESLVEGQLALISDLETHETDPDQLASLFRLDHLATRMRRNGENLLVLSGEQPSRSWDQPVPLVDVLRAASSEVEQYHRIELVGVSDSPHIADIHGLAVTDLVHLLAELLENAVMFSSPQTRVRVTATRLPDGRVMVEIHDQGIGLLPEDFTDINHKLAHPPAVDATLSQRMGLFVVGRLANRHGIRVQLRPAEHGGTTALVMLPDAITQGGAGAFAQPIRALPHCPGRAWEVPPPRPFRHWGTEFAVSSIIPEQQAQTALPPRTAAELGFDDSRYGDVPEPAADLDPVSRSLRRRGRHGAGTQPQARPGDDTAADPSEAAGARQPSYVAAAPDAHGATSATVQRSARHAFRPDDYPEAPEADRFGAPRNPSGRDHVVPHQGERAQHGSFQAAMTNSGGSEAESSQVTDGNNQNSVGFSRSASAPGTQQTAHELTDAGLPRRGPLGNGDTGASAASPGRPGQPDTRQDSSGPVVGGTPADALEASLGDTPPLPEQRGGTPAHASKAVEEPQEPEGHGGSFHGEDQATPSREPAVAQPDQGARRSANDERWERAEALRTPRAGGITPSGLPKRTPRANLVEGTAEQTPQGGPQVSRAPQDVGGRLSSLHRGVQQGHSEGRISKGRAGNDPHSGPTDPDSTYTQER